MTLLINNCAKFGSKKVQEPFMNYLHKLLLISSLAWFTSTASPVKAVKLTEPIYLDGKLTEFVWKRNAPVSDFKQRDPNQGVEPTEKTEVWVAYDNDALYIAARMYDSQPDSIMAILGRRDYFVTADWFAVFLDSYKDKRSGNFFGVGPAGTMVDGVLYNDDWDNSDWDGVWEGKTNVDEKGWTVELHIPFSQLRFQDKNEQVWGINFRRDIGRKNEKDYLVYQPRMQSGFVSRFPDLVGIEGIKPSQSLEILPFVTTKAEYTHPDAENPFKNSSEYSPDLGADFRYALGANLTLKATMNPDFGQVEVDPAVVNLSDVESFFQEKRPFFVEGANTFTMFGRGGGNNYWNFNFPEPTFFYSRRIGRAPRWNEEFNNSDFTDFPFATRIIGAGKIVGKVNDSWNVGTIHAVTRREFGRFQKNGVSTEMEVEPLTYYGIARMQKEFPEGKQGLGVMSTFTSRQFSNDPLNSKLKNWMNDKGGFAGVDGWTFLDGEKMWVVTSYAGLSYVEGTKARITDLQQNSQHYFQRPDADYLEVDTNATSLMGYIARMFLIKQKGNSYFNASAGIVDPNFEINDIGFLTRTEVINMHIGGGYVWTEPDGTFRTKEFGGGFGQSYDFGGNLTNRYQAFWSYLQWMNYYSITVNGGFSPAVTYNNSRTRGGPTTLNGTGWDLSIYGRSDDRKNIFVEGYLNTSEYQFAKSINYGTGLQFRPAANVSFSIGPDFTIYNDNLQWVDSYSDPFASATYGKQYIFGEMEQKTIAANIRLNWTFTPTLSLQLFMQPLISSALYKNYKMLAKSKSSDGIIYGENGSSIQRIVVNFQTDEVDYVVDADGDNGPAPSYRFDNRDFNYKSLRGNAVLRWEYLPGSAIYFVWTQNRNDNENHGEFQFNHSLTRLADVKADNIFLIKMSYYLNE